MADVFNWRCDSPQTLVECAARALAEGQIVAFPSDTVYLAAGNALQTEVVQRLTVGEAHEQLTLVPPLTATGALAPLPAWCPLARRLARKCWPGPVTLALPPAQVQPLLDPLPPAVSAQLTEAGRVRLRLPGHEAFLEVQQQSGLRLVFRSLGPASGPPLSRPEEAQGCSEPPWSILIEDGPCEQGGPATVVAVQKENWQIVQPGVVPPEEVQRLAARQIVFVCTGNTCRSPLAEALCKKLLAEQLGCRVEDLLSRGFLVLSAGIAAMMGGEATPTAVETAREFGADLSQHHSQPLTAQLLAQADLVLAMTRSHLLAVQRYADLLGFRAELLAPNGSDIADPMGGEQDVYQDCARQIWQHLQQRLPGFQEI